MDLKQFSFVSVKKLIEKPFLYVNLQPLTEKQKHIMRTLFNFFVAAAFATVILGCSGSTRGGQDYSSVKDSSTESGVVSTATGKVAGYVEKASIFTKASLMPRLKDFRLLRRQTLGMVSVAAGHMAQQRLRASVQDGQATNRLSSSTGMMVFQERTVSE